MEIKLAVSPTMSIDKDKGLVSIYEHRMIRIPKACREHYNLKMYDFVQLRNRAGRISTLQVLDAYDEDAKKDSQCGYVTSEVYDDLFIKNRSSEIDYVTNITLGCDPEVFLVDSTNGAVSAAYRFFIRKQSDVGHDGMLLEFRPAPGLTAEDVCYNLWTLICKARYQLNMKPDGGMMSMIAGSSYKGLTAGFHLHYGLPKTFLRHRQNNLTIAKLMTAVFDYYVGVPSIIPEGNDDTTRRTARFVAYGKPGGFRIDDITFEFRLPGGVNMKHPILARGLMALGSVVAEDVVSRINTCTDCFTNLNEMVNEVDLKKLYPNLPDMHTFFGIICNPDINAAKIHLDKVIKEDVRKMIGYAQRAATVETYFECLEKNISNNIEENWGGFYNAKQQGQMVFL